MESNNSKQLNEVLNDLSKQVYDDARHKGFYKELDVRKELYEIIDEVHEAMGAYDPQSVHLKDMFSFELADIIIHTLSLAGAMEIKIGDYIEKKININKQRGYLHGKF